MSVVLLYFLSLSVIEHIQAVKMANKAMACCNIERFIKKLLHWEQVTPCDKIKYNICHHIHFTIRGQTNNLILKKAVKSMQMFYFLRVKCRKEFVHDCIRFYHQFAFDYNLLNVLFTFTS